VNKRETLKRGASRMSTGTATRKNVMKKKGIGSFENDKSKRNKIRVRRLRDM
jgi:hypothetical protein